MLDIKILLLVVLFVKSVIGDTSRSIDCGINIDPGNTAFGNPPAKSIVALNASWISI